MAVRKDDPMYYRNKVKDLIKEAQDNGLKVHSDKHHKGTYLYFEAHECEIWGVKLPEDEREESYE